MVARSLMPLPQKQSQKIAISEARCMRPVLSPVPLPAGSRGLFMS